jgi:hypothetical protein
VDNVVYGQYQQAYAGLSLKYGVVVDRVVAHAAVNNLATRVDQVAMLEKQFL